MSKLINSTLCQAIVCVAAAVGFGGCRSLSEPPVHSLSYHDEAVNVDGRLEEARYRTSPFTTEFKAVSRMGEPVPETKVWLGWNRQGLWFAFAGKDARLATAPPSADEHAVDIQDRMEIFLWPRRTERYFCMEIAPGGAVHDYSARIYRCFDDSWRPEGAQLVAQPTADGYTVEGFLPVNALRQMGLNSWKSGTKFCLGLFRADFEPGAPGNPHWLTWIDPRLPQADFHVRGAFAPVVLRR